MLRNVQLFLHFSNIVLASTNYEYVKTNHYKKYISLKFENVHIIFFGF